MANHHCTGMTTHLAGEEVAIICKCKFREYEIRYLDGGTLGKRDFEDYVGFEE